MRDAKINEIYDYSKNNSNMQNVLACISCAQHTQGRINMGTVTKDATR